jgi:hypothetical protein
MPDLPAIPNFHMYRRSARTIDDVTSWITFHIPEFIGMTLADNEFMRSTPSLPWRCRSSFKPTPELRQKLLAHSPIEGIFYLGSAESFICAADELICDVTVNQWPCLASFVVSAYMSNLDAPDTCFVGASDVEEMITGTYPGLTMADLHAIHAMHRMTGSELNQWLRQFVTPAASDVEVALPLLA